MSLSKIRIEMARNHEFPEGSALHGYEFVAPLDKKGHIDAKADDDEAGYRFGDHAFIAGEYISIREHDEDMNTFRIISVIPLD